MQLRLCLNFSINSILFVTKELISSIMQAIYYRLSISHYLFIKKYSSLHFPMEACGLLGEKKGKNGKINLRVFPTQNDSKYKNRFRISNADFWKNSKLAEFEGYSIVGCFHSHPNNIAYPSSRDITLSQKNTFKLWLIFSVKYNQINLYYMDYLPRRMNIKIE